MLDRNLYRRCGLLVAASEALREELVAPPHRHPPTIRVVAPGSDVATCRPVPDLRHGRRAAAISVGNWMARKGTLELLDALGRLPDDRVTLHLAGRDDVEPASPSGSAAASPSSATGSCTTACSTGTASPRLYAGADVFVLPSWREPYGTVYGEAAAGLPVVGWRAGNLPTLSATSRGWSSTRATSRPRRRARPAGPRRAVARRGPSAGRRGAALPRWTDTAAALFAALKELTGSAR